MPTLLTYEQIAAEIGMPRGTLSRKLIIHNRTNPERSIKPDEIQDHGHYRTHLFYRETASRMKAAMKAMNTPRGRKKKPAPQGEAS